jgi:hypothetical protein
MTYVTNNIAAFRPTPQNDQADAKGDVRLSDNDNLSGRWSIAAIFRRQRDRAPDADGDGVERADYCRCGYLDAFLSSSIVNELRFGYGRVVISDLSIDPTAVGRGRQLGTGNSGGQPIAGASAIVIGDGITQIGSASAIGETVENKFQLGNNLTVARGRHFLKMGGQIIRFHQNRY